MIKNFKLLINNILEILNLKNLKKRYSFFNTFYNILNTYITIIFFEIIKIFNIVNNNKKTSYIIFRGPDIEIYTIQKISLISISLRVTGFFFIFLLLLLYSILDIIIIEIILIDIFNNFIKNIRNFNAKFYINILEFSNFLKINTIIEPVEYAFKFETYKDDLIIKIIENKNYSFLKKFISSNLYFIENIIFGETSWIKFSKEAYYTKDKIVFLSNPNDILNENLKEKYQINNSYEKHPFLYQIYLFDILDVFGTQSLNIFEKKNLNQTYEIMNICLTNENNLKLYPEKILNYFILIFFISLLFLFFISHIIIGFFKKKKEIPQNIKNFYFYDENINEKLLNFIKPDNFFKKSIYNFILKYIIISKCVLNVLYGFFNWGSLFNFDFMDPVRKNWTFLKWGAVSVSLFFSNFVTRNFGFQRTFTMEDRFSVFEEKYLSHLSITFRFIFSRIFGYYFIVTFPKTILEFGFIFFNSYDLIIPDINNIFVSLHFNNDILNELSNEFNKISNKFLYEIENIPRVKYNSKINKIISVVHNGKSYKDFSTHNLNSFFFNRQYILRNNPNEKPNNNFALQDYITSIERTGFRKREYFLTFHETSTAQMYYDLKYSHLFKTTRNQRLPIFLNRSIGFYSELSIKIFIQEYACRIILEKKLSEELTDIAIKYYDYYTNKITLTDLEMTELTLRKQNCDKLLLKLANIYNSQLFFTHPTYYAHQNLIGQKTNFMIMHGGLDDPHSYNFLIRKGWLQSYNWTNEKYSYKYYSSKYLFNNCITQQRFYDPKVVKFYIRENGIHVGN